MPFWSLGYLAVLISAPRSAVGQPAPSAAAGGADSIVVTARRRSEHAQDIPITMAAFGSAEIEARDLLSLDRLQRAEPSLHVFGFNARLTSISLRALGGNAGLTSDGLDGGVGVFVDDVYIGRPGAAMFNFADLERIEVLRGPQGTLFGRNTTAGAVRIITQAPRLDSRNVALDASVGDYGRREVRASMTGPLRGETLAARLTVAATHHDGYGYNEHSGEAHLDLDDALVRGQLLFAPAAPLRIRLTADYGKQDQDCCSAVAVGVFTELDSGAPVPNGYLARTARVGFEPLPFEPFQRRVATDAEVQSKMRQRGASTVIDWSLRKLDLTSITAYRDWDWNPRGDFDDTPAPAITFAHTANRTKQTSQELRLATRGDERVDFVAGFYHFAETVDGLGQFGYGPAAPAWFLVPAAGTASIDDAALNGFAAEATSSVTTRSDALFGQAVVHLAERLDLTVGGRYTYERRHGGFQQEQRAGQSLAMLDPASAAAAQAVRDRFHPQTSYAASVRDDGRTGNLTLSYRVSPAVLAYGTAARGRKAGGINIGNFPQGVDPAIRPEKVDHFELGAKTALGAHLTVNVALYRTVVSDYQTSLTQSPAAGARLIQFIANIDEARSQGGEIDAAWMPSQRFELGLGIAHTDAEYATFANGLCPPEISLTPASCDSSGQSIAGAPKRALSLSLQGRENLPGAFDLLWGLDYQHQSDVHMAVSNSRYSLVEAYGLANIRLGMRHRERGWELVWWMRNAFDDEYFQFIAGRSTGLVAGLTGEPRTVGVTYKGRF